jgi:glycosyltransferase involved in cell wall biosynthesis
VCSSDLRYGKACEVICDFSYFLPCFLCSREAGKVKNRWFVRFNPLAWLIVYSRFKKVNKNLKKFDYFIGISNFIKERLIQKGYQKEKISVVYNIVELDKFLKLKSKKNKVPKILYLGAYVESKGPQILLQALKGIKEKYECNLYGEGVLRPELEKFVESNDLNVKIHDKVPSDKVPQIMAEHDIIVFPSIVAEGMGRIAVEAMAAGKVVIGSDIGGIKDLIQHGKTGFVFKSGDSVRLQECLTKVMRNKMARVSLVNNGLDYVGINFSEKKITKEVIEIYRRLE